MFILTLVILIFIKRFKIYKYTLISKEKLLNINMFDILYKFYCLSVGRFLLILHHNWMFMFFKSLTSYSIRCGVVSNNIGVTTSKFWDHLTNLED